MKKLLHTFAIVVLPLALHAQTNSVELKNASNVLISQHNSITSAYAAIPATITQGYIVEITSTYTGANETYPIVFGPKAGSSATNTITLRPASGVANATISTSSAITMQLNDADYHIIDGRAGGTGSGYNLKIDNLSTSTLSFALELINSATYNQIKYVHLYQAAGTSAGPRVIHFATAATPPANSNNLIENCKIQGSRSGIYLGGTASNKNTGNVIKGCEIYGWTFAGVWLQSNNSAITIDSCSIYQTATSSTNPTGIIGAAVDTLVVTKNRIFDLQYGTSTGALKGITVTGATSSITIVNNFIALTSSNSTGSTNVSGIECTGSNPQKGIVAFNSIRIGGTLASGGTSGNIGSVCILKSNSSTTSEYNFRNNILINERTGGNAGLQHLAGAITDINGIILGDYNVYNSASGDLVRLQTTVFTTLASYQAIVTPNDANSNTSSVLFVSNTDLHLTGASVGAPALAGQAMAGITTDIDGQARTVPYKGADEAIVITSCTGTPAHATISGPAAAVCVNTSQTFTATGFASGAGISYKWQSRPAATGGFTDIPAATATSLTTTVTQATDYRMVTMCSGSGLADTSNVVTVNVTPLPVAGSITEVHAGLSYTFTAVGVQNSTSDLWLYGDGNSGTSTSHTYAAGGTYTVRHAVANACGNDTATLVITAVAPLCSGTPGHVTITGPANACENAVFIVSASGQSTGNGISYQWQFQPVGASAFIDVPAPGGTGTTLNFASPADVELRFITTCSGSGLSDTSNILLIDIDSLPDAGNITRVIAGNTVTFTANGVLHAASQIWHYGDGTSDATGVHTYTSGGNYNVMFIATNPCGSDTAFNLVALGIDDDAGRLADLMSLYPNPANDYIQLKTLGKISFNAVTIINTTGAVVLKEDIVPVKEHTLSIANLAAGIYILRIQTPEGVINKQFSVIR